MSEFSRRGILSAGAGVALAGGSAPAQAGHSEFDPRKTAEGQVKLEAALDSSPVFWSYSGVIYAVRPDQRPLPILALAGCQSSWAQAREDGSWRVAGAIVTFFRDPATGAFLQTFDNPFTGARNPVAPNILRGGGVIFPADGTSARAEGQIKTAVIAPQGFAAADPDHPLGAVRWSVSGETVMLMTDRAWNVRAQPQIEAQTKTADRAAFFDRKVRRLPVRFTATTIIPWMTWMNMADAPGHLVWHSSGEKLFSLGDLPEDYSAHGRSFLDTLAAPPKA